MKTTDTIEINVAQPEELQDARVKRWRELERVVVEELRDRIYTLRPKARRSSFTTPNQTQPVLQLATSLAL